MNSNLIKGIAALVVVVALALGLVWYQSKGAAKPAAEAVAGSGQPVAAEQQPVAEQQAAEQQQSEYGKLAIPPAKQ